MGWTKSIRFKALMDLREAFPDEIALERENGKTICLNVKYEKLPTICYYCGRLDHVECDCAEKEENEDGGPVYQYGEWMRASPWKDQRIKKGEDGRIQNLATKKLVFKPKQSGLEALQNNVEDVAEGLLKVKFGEEHVEKTSEKPEHLEESPQPLTNVEPQQGTKSQGEGKEGKKKWHRLKRDTHTSPNKNVSSIDPGTKRNLEDAIMDDIPNQKKVRQATFFLDDNIVAAEAEDQPRRAK